jgi:hypothetical protein
MMNAPDKKTPIKTGVPDHEDVNIVLRLYDLRRETVMREARHFVNFEFFPKSHDEFMEVMTPAHPKNAYIRQVSTYWEMAATFVNMGALHEDLFWNTNGESVFFYAKIQPFLERARKDMAAPQMMVQLETLIKRRPDGEERLKAITERQRRMLESIKAHR